jgi:hypothetical protein
VQLLLLLLLELLDAAASAAGKLLLSLWGLLLEGVGPADTAAALTL